MDPIKQAIEALTPFAAIYERWSDGRIYDVGVEVRPYDLERAAEALAELQKPTGFEEWWKENYYHCFSAQEPGTVISMKDCAHIAWDAAMLARIPAEIRERCLEALRFYLKKYPDPSYAAARAWLEGK